MDTLQDGSIGFGLVGIPASDHPGDISAPRLQASIAVPTEGTWSVEILTDSGKVLEGNSWSRAKRLDPVSGRMVPTRPRDRDGWSVARQEGFRIVRMDFPLVVPVANGLKLRERVRLRLDWSGAARLPSGSPWAKAIDNPNGISIRPSIAPRKTTGTGLAEFSGTMIDVSVGDDDPFASAEDGVVRLTGTQLSKVAGVLPGTVDFAHVAVYAGRSDTAPAQNGESVEPPSLFAIPIERIDRDRDGILGPDDEIRFWGRGTNLWKPVENSPQGWRYAINPYTKRRNYLVRLDANAGSSGIAPAIKPGGTNVFPTVGQPVWVGKPNKLKEVEIGNAAISEPDIGKDWYWFSTENTGIIQVPTGTLAFPGKAADSILARVAVTNTSWFAGKDIDVGRFRAMGESGSWNLVDPLRMVWSGSAQKLSSGGFEIEPSTKTFAMAGIDLQYRRDLSKTDSAVFPAPSLGALSVPVPDDRGCWVLDDGIAVRECAVQAGLLTDSATTSNTWYAYFPKTPGGIRVSLSVRKESQLEHSVHDFFRQDLSVEVLVVTPASFAARAETYAKHREAAFQIRPMKTAIVNTEDIYDLWSGGKMDPSAIRECIRWAHERWGVSHVLLLGAGHSDPRMVKGAAPEVLIPHWEQGAVATDDFFSFLLPGDPTTDNKVHEAQVAIGRIPARTATEVENWQRKLDVFENPAQADFGPWRNTVVLAADDMMQVAKPDEIPNHTNQSEVVGDAMSFERPWIRNEKLYLLEYPVNSVYEKPEAARDLQSLMNRGAVGLNYLGHGGPTLLADEDLLDNSSIERNLTNRSRPFVFLAGSCTVGRNDIPNGKGLGELLVVAPDKGAIASIAGTRPTYPVGNGRLSAEFWRKSTDTLSGLTIGEALLAAKNANDESLDGIYTNRDVYNLLGDPATVLFPLGLPAQVDQIQDTIAALSQIRVKGTSKGAQFFQVRMEVRSALDTAPRPAEKQDLQIYRLSPTQMISLQSPTLADSITTTLQVPARIAFGDSATLRVYVWNTSSRRDGGQVLSPRLLFGTAGGGGTETQGPSISMRPCDSSWSGGIPFAKVAQIPPQFCIEVALEDTSGISSETGPDEGVVFALPGVKEPWHPDLRQLSDFRHATAQLVIDSTLMLPGKSYTFEVLARDLMGNKSQSRLQIQTLARNEYSLYEVFNSPNPVREGENTAFHFKLASASDSTGAVDSRVQAAIRIHSVSGKLVRVLQTELSQVSQPRPRAVWNLRDSFGNPVANGLYPYTVILRIPDRTGSTSTEIVRKGTVAISR